MKGLDFFVVVAESVYIDIYTKVCIFIPGDEGVTRSLLSFPGASRGPWPG